VGVAIAVAVAADAVVAQGGEMHRLPRAALEPQQATDVERGRRKLEDRPGFDGQGDADRHDHV
jgi:hypothetical protein